MAQANPRRYLETQVLTASKEQLLLMLYDGAIRFCEQGREAMAARDIPRTHDLLVRAQRILIELWCALNPAVDATLAKTLGGLYSFLYLRLVEANVRKDAAAVDGVVGILKSLRQGWGEAIHKARADAGASDNPSLQLTG